MLIRSISRLFAPLVVFCSSFLVHPVSATQPNVLMIAIDDLNDWVEPLGGHPQAQTPTIMSLAQRGMSFRNAHCQSPLCNSSRISVMTSRRPSSTGIYGLEPWFRHVPELRDIVSMPQYFHRAGYTTYVGGKVYHNNAMGKNPPEGIEPEFDFFGPNGGPGIMPPKKLVPLTPNNNPWVDWGVFEHDVTQKGDWIVADWAEKTLAEMPTSDSPDAKPFFMAVGFFLPHVPCHVTPEWWAKYDHETLILPKMKPNDRADCSPFSWYLHWNLPEPRLSWLEHHDQHRNLVHAYLSCITFTDSQVARVLAALEASGQADNTIIVLWSDHGWHLGEKEMTGKTTLWEPSTRVPLIFAGPGVSVGQCDEPAELLDIYPTLAELAGLDAPPNVEGLSLVPQIKNPESPKGRPAITDHNPGNHGLRDRDIRLIRYADGSEELYDIRKDPDEFENRIQDPAYAEAAQRLRKFIPSNVAPLAPGSSARVLEQREDGWYWEGGKIDPDNPPMGIGSTPKSKLPRN